MLLQYYNNSTRTDNNPPPSLFFQFRPHFRPQAFIFCSMRSLLFNYENQARDKLLINCYEAYLKEQLISYFLVTADSSTDMDSMDSSPWYFSGPTSSQTLILCPRWLQWCDPGTGPGYRPGKWTPNHKITSEFVKFFSELKYLLFSFPCQFFWSVNMFRFSKSIVKSWLGASHVRSFDAVWNVWRLDACPLSSCHQPRQ